MLQLSKAFAGSRKLRVPGIQFKSSNLQGQPCNEQPGATAAQTGCIPAEPQAPKVKPSQLETNEYLAGLLEPRGGGVTGPEKAKKLDHGITVYKDPHGSYRFVKEVDGEAVAAIQVMSRNGVDGQVAKAYTKPEERRKGYGKQLVQMARNQFQSLTFSDDRSKDGDLFVRAIANKPATPKVITNAKTAASLISKEVVKWAVAKEKQGRMVGEVPTEAEVESNWMKVFRSRKANEGNKPAFVDLNPQLKAAIEEGIKSNDGNKRFQEFVAKHGEALVVYRRQEKGRSAAAEWRGAIHIFDSPFWEGEGTDELKPGGGTAGGDGGYAAVIRHEYGHKLHEKLSVEQQREWRELIPDSEQIAKGLTSYAAKNAEETFCELFAIVTDERYKPGIFPSWVDDLHAKQKEWLL